MDDAVLLAVVSTAGRAVLVARHVSDTDVYDEVLGEYDGRRRRHGHGYRDVPVTRCRALARARVTAESAS